MIVSQRIASIFRSYGFITLDPLMNWLVTKYSNLPSPCDILNILRSNPSHYARSVAPWKIDPSHWVEVERDKWVKLPEDDPVFGYTTIGALTSSFMNLIMGTNYQVTEGAGVIDSLLIALDNVGGTDTIKLGLYNLASNSQTADPSTLLYGGTVFDPTVEDGWNQFDIPVSEKPSILDDTWYNVCGRAEAADPDGYYDSGGVANSSKYQSIPYGDDWPDPYGSPTQSSSIGSMYVSYTKAIVLKTIKVKFLG